MSLGSSLVGVHVPCFGNYLNTERTKKGKERESMVHGCEELSQCFSPSKASFLPTCRNQKQKAPAAWLAWPMESVTHQACQRSYSSSHSNSTGGETRIGQSPMLDGTLFIPNSYNSENLNSRASSMLTGHLLSAKFCHQSGRDQAA